MSFSPAILAFQLGQFEAPRRRFPRGGRPPARVRIRPQSDHRSFSWVAFSSSSAWPWSGYGRRWVCCCRT